MKYKVYVEKDEKGKPWNYGVACKFLWWWIPCGAFGYTNRKYAEDVCAQMNGKRQIL